MRIACLLALCVAVGAAEEDVSKLLDPIRVKHDLPAMGGAIVRGDALVAIGVTGVRKRGSKVKVKTEDRWHLGSCTKSMTATLIGRYIDRGKLRWDDTLKTRLIKKFPDMHRDYRGITIAQLLRHRAGVPSDLSFDGLWAQLWKRDGTPLAQRRLLTAEVLKRAPLSKPDETYLYANAGFAIAGHALEVRTGKSWESLMRSELFKPLGMKSAGFGAPGSGLDQPWGHGAAGPVAPGPNADNPPAIGPAGTVHASLRDWSKYVALHLQGARDGERKLLLKRATLRRIQTPEPNEEYAFGWIATSRGWGDGTVLTHSGSNTMWYCVAWLAPKRDFAVLVTCNQGGAAAAKACDEAAGALIREAQRKKPS